MDSDSESLLDQDMNSSASSSRASTPTHHEDFHVSCKRKREIERELKTYTDSIDHCQVLIRNLERQGLVNHPIYSNQCAMIQGLMRQREWHVKSNLQKETFQKAFYIILEEEIPDK
ncbi:hypothetical protein NPIL_295311 [Nephila pilipes]|uniref:Uncharacterized protein n=1 Tax=Nephila pilipes TaxID=299642 RepID=A0A8X6P917_NEPPI|nr:hypothetical protein NPIL_295311 [Nephila pilipes]